MNFRRLKIGRERLDHVNFIQDADQKFLYAVSRNKDHFDSALKSLDNILKLNEEEDEKIKEYNEEIEKINAEFAEKEEDGITVAFIMAEGTDGKKAKAYKKVTGEGNPQSPYMKKLEKLKEKYKDILDEQKTRVKKYNKMLDEEIPEDDLRKLMIDLSLIPKGLDPKAMDGVILFVKDVNSFDDEKQETPEPEKKKDKKS